MPPWNSPQRRPRDLRQEAIDETSAFLSWALAQDGRAPRIPTRRVYQGGFTSMLRERAARVLVDRWWSRALEFIER